MRDDPRLEQCRAIPIGISQIACLELKRVTATRARGADARLRIIWGHRPLCPVNTARNVFNCRQCGAAGDTARPGAAASGVISNQRWPHLAGEAGVSLDSRRKAIAGARKRPRRGRKAKKSRPSSRAAPVKDARRSGRAPEGGESSMPSRLSRGARESVSIAGRRPCAALSNHPYPRKIKGTWRELPSRRADRAVQDAQGACARASNMDRSEQPRPKAAIVDLRARRMPSHIGAGQKKGGASSDIAARLGGVLVMGRGHRDKRQSLLDGDAYLARIFGRVWDLGYAVLSYVYVSRQARSRGIPKWTIPMPSCPRRISGRLGLS